MRTEPANSRGSVRRRRNSLKHDVILDAAERVAEVHGGGLTMRQISDELGASAMSIYRYFDSKENLVAQLLDRVMGRFEFPDSTGNLAVDLDNFARSHKRLLDRHAWAVPMLFTHPSPGLNTHRIGEAALSILVRGGLAHEDAVSVFSSVLALNYGWLSFATARDKAVINGEVGLSLAESFPLLDETEFPVTRLVANELTRYGTDRHYEIALGTLVAGLQHR